MLREAAVALGRILSRPAYIALAAASALLYYSLFYFVILHSNLGVFIPVVPMYLVYAVAATSAALLCIAVYSAMERRSHSSGAAARAGTASAVAPVLTSLVSSCSCSYSAIGVFLSYIGVGGAFGISVVIGEYATYIIAALLVINLALVLHYSSRLGRRYSKRR